MILIIVQVKRGANPWDGMEDPGPGGRGRPARRLISVGSPWRMPSLMLILQKDYRLADELLGPRSSEQFYTPQTSADRRFKSQAKNGTGIPYRSIIGEPRASTMHQL
jgi:hypothetical protein